MALLLECICINDNSLMLLVAMANFYLKKLGPANCVCYNQNFATNWSIYVINVYFGPKNGKKLFVSTRISL